MSKMSSLLRQRNLIGSWWGGIKLVGQHVTSYIQLIVLCFTSITAYSVIENWLLSNGIHLSIWYFSGAIIIVLGLLVIFEYVVSFPSFFAMWNKQVWEHENPIKAELEKVHRELEEIRKELKNVTSK